MTNTAKKETQVKEEPKQKGSFRDAMKKSSIVKEDPYYPPEFQDHKDQDYSGMDMARLVRDRNLKHADFTGAKLKGTIFDGFNLQGAIFRNCDITDASFVGADCRWAVFNNVKGLDDADFTNADNKGAVVS